MKMTFRWFGDDDRVPLEYIRQIPGVSGVVTALHDIPAGEVWELDRLEQRKDAINAAGLAFAVVESIPVHEDIKLGRPAREKFVDTYAESIRNVGEIGVPVICYNFMPVFDWTRTDLEMPLHDGSTALAFDDDALSGIDLSAGTGNLPGWAAAYSAAEMSALIAAWAVVSEDQVWDNLAWFLERIIPVAESCGVKMAIHPDDPPWSIFGLPRIATSGAALERITKLVDSPSNGVTFCTGSLGADAGNDLPKIAARLGSTGRIHFAHCRNVKRTGIKQFHEAPHPTRFGDVDMLGVLRALRDTGFNGPMRPDHGRMIWGEMGRPGYGLYDRALGATYLYGMWEALSAGGSE